MPNNIISSIVLTTAWEHCLTEMVQVDWLIVQFNHCFAHERVALVRGEHEPEYIPATATDFAQIRFAHGFFNSALHEISHWCIAGTQRRTLSDLGYWYAPDGRSAAQQILFEQVEIKPQALEWLFARACLRPFQVSLDNLTGHRGNGQQFKDNVYHQVKIYLQQPDTIPKDGQHWIQYLCQRIRHGIDLSIDEFRRADLD